MLMQELIDAAKHQLINNHERIQHLSSSSGLPQDGETEETYTEFTQAIAEWDASQVATGGLSIQADSQTCGRPKATT